MSFSHWFLLAGLGVLIWNALFQFFLLFRKAHLDDLSEPKGSMAKGVAYSMTAAMSPVKKETAFLHLPTYTAGIVYHVGSFLALAWLIPHFFGVPMPGIVSTLSVFLLAISSVCGMAILLKRIVNPKLRDLSVPDDYFSNLIVTGFHIVTALTIWDILSDSSLFMYAGILFLYIPIGKLRHVIFFFPARFYLGLFYGKRGVWPPSRRNVWQTRNF